MNTKSYNNMYMQERCTSIPAESVYGSVTPNSILLSCILYYIFVGVFTRAAAAENATGIYRNWYRLTCYIICVYNRYEVPIIHTWNKHFLCVTWTATSRFPLAHKHVKYNNIMYMVHLCMVYCTTSSLQSYITSYTAAAGPFPHSCGRGALFFTVFSSCLTLN